MNLHMMFTGEAKVHTFHIYLHAFVSFLITIIAFVIYRKSSLLLVKYPTFYFLNKQVFVLIVLLKAYAFYI